jgi:hypothetical protein
MAWNFGESVKSSIQVGSGIQLLDEETQNFYKAALDEAANKLASTPVQGSKYFKVKNVDKNNYSSQDVYGVGLAQVNSDAEDLAVDKQIVGFEQTISNFVIRLAMAIGRESLETDRFGVIGEHSSSLMQSSQKTIERLLADTFNRGFGTADGGTTATTNLSALAEDGLALFSGNRPQPRATAGTWENLNAAGALTATTVADARTQFNTYLDGNGDLAPQMLEKVIVSPELEDTMREISGTTLKVDTSLNTTNIVSGTEYEVWHWLNANTIIYCGDADNGVEYHVRRSPSINTWEDGTNPDKIWTRMRMALGTGIKRPGKYIGQLTS